MSKWIVNTYTFSPIQGGYFVTQGNLNYTLISGNLTLNAGDTSKVTFVVPKSVADDLYPVRTLVEVKFGNGLNPERKFFGTVVKKTRVIPDGTYKFEAVGVLGSYQFLPNYNGYGSDATILGIISTESQRFRGNYQPGSQYYTPNPWEALYSGHNEIPSSFGQLSMNNINLRLTCNLDSLQKKSKNAYEFLKSITKEHSFVLPEDYVNPPYTFRWFEYGETAQFKMISGDNDQSITYDTNLISCSLAEEPYYTRVMTYSNGNGTYNFSDQSANGYPCPFNYARIPLPNKTDGSAYTYTEVQNATREELKKYPQLIEATAFDRHIIDESVPWLDMSKRVYVFYAPDEYVKAEITQIVYDFADPTEDRVKLGKIVQTATDSISTVSEQIENTVKEYLPLSGGTMTGGIAFKDSSSVVNDSKVTIHGRIFGTCNLIGELEQGGIDFNDGSDQAITTRLKSGFTSIKASTTYTLKFSTTNNLRIRAIVYYNANKGWVSTSQYGANATEATFTTPSGVGYLRVVLQNTSSGTVVPSEVYNFQLEKGTSSSPYAPYAMDNVELTQLVSPTKDTFYHSTQVARTTSLDDSGTFLNLKRGWYTIMAEAVANNASIHSIAIVNIYSGTSYELLDYKQSQSISGLSQSRLSASWSGYLDFDSTTVKVYVRYNGTGSNQVFICAKKLV